MLSQIQPGDNGIGTAVVTENRCNGFIKSPTQLRSTSGVAGVQNAVQYTAFSDSLGEGGNSFSSCIAAR